MKEHYHGMRQPDREKGQEKVVVLDCGSLEELLDADDYLTSVSLTLGYLFAK